MDDPYDLNRFVDAQEGVYERALTEIVSGRKLTHWMWYIFPQIDGLALSSTSKRFAIKSAEEARAYLDHPVLGPRLLKCAEAVIDVEERSARSIFGSPDDLKLRSSATLFASVLPTGSALHRLLAKYFEGVPDGNTLSLTAPRRWSGFRIISEQQVHRVDACSVAWSSSRDRRTGVWVQRHSPTTTRTPQRRFFRSRHRRRAAVHRARRRARS